jgi:hypothetical protein
VIERERDIPPVVWRVASGVSALIGVAASALAARFFWLAVDAQEVDPAVKLALAFAAALFVLAEVALFTIAGLMPNGRHRGLRAKLVLAGCVLLAFEVASIYASQVVIASAADARERAAQTRIGELKSTIARQRETAQALIESGRLSGQSVVAASRANGVAALEKAAAIEASTLALANEMADLERRKVATVSGIFGQVGSVVMAAVRSVLVSSIGLLFFGLAGVLWRMSRADTPPVPQPAPASTEKPASPATAGLKPEPVGVPVPESVAVPMAETQPVPDRYQVIRQGVIAGELKPSVRSLQARFGGSTTTARQHLDRLHDEGVIQDMGTGRGYALVAVRKKRNQTQQSEQQDAGHQQRQPAGEWEGA